MGIAQMDSPRWTSKCVATRHCFDIWTHSSNLVEAVFHEADRCVVVLRRIQDDETCSSNGCYEHYALLWMDLRRLGPTQTLVRYFSVRSIFDLPEPLFRSFRDANVDSLLCADEDGAVWSVDGSDLVQNAPAGKGQEAAQSFEEERRDMRQALAIT
ncbi:Aste57867_605 [Aphanomyces stellatus]|uniref:Aste57867_605 protein n=1 Tax=Aphanomyces stellatus TaxID=120398 RepID=A0A485K376_9STRA|nr:hypothetical protein As57867_000604 [Aphanomyces stellatus]VFT77830.1 Aste57867_605 [Aphanomyces stellatus]